MDSTKNFSGLASTYTVGRPAYAAEFIHSLYTNFGFSPQSVIADVGAGTGKFTKQLLDRGSTVYCIEPNDDMREAAARELGSYAGFRAVKGTADATGLENTSVDFVTTAQAFHWFDPAAFRAECRRILKPDGQAFLIWNLRDMTDEMNRRCHAVYKEFCPNFKGFGGGIERDDPRIAQFFGGKYDCAVFDHPLCYDKETFLSRSLSGSYSLKAGDARFAEYVEALGALFDAYAENGILTMANQTVVYYGMP